PINGTSSFVTNITVSGADVYLGAIAADDQYLWVGTGINYPGFWGGTWYYRMDRIALSNLADWSFADNAPNVMVSAGAYLYASGGQSIRRYSKSDGSWGLVAGVYATPGYADGVG